MRAYNDIDHITPIIYKLNKVNMDFTITVLIFNVENDFDLDYRLQFLKNLKIRVIHILDFIDIKYIPRKVFFNLIRINNNLNRYNPMRIFVKTFILKPLYIYINRKVEYCDIQNSINKIGKPKIIIFDQGTNDFYKKLCAYSKLNEITTVAVPHGHNTLANELIWENSMDVSFNSSSNQWKFYEDDVVFENNII